MANTQFFTSESVCAGHPDKICDQISDSLVDAALAVDEGSRVAVETLVTAHQIVLAGEVSCSQTLDFETIAQSVIRDLGYTDQDYGFSDQSPLSLYVHQQSPEIATGVDQDGAGDQGMMFGYACTETTAFLPLPIQLAHALAKQIDVVRSTRVLEYLRPDGKTQVTVRYENGAPVAVETIVIAVPHREAVALAQVRDDIYIHVIQPVLEKYGYSISLDRVLVNGTGVWHRGGPASDTGLTGRKIVVDTYGGYARVGGGCFSGKDPTKVDRSGAYAARYLAKHIVAAGLAERAEVALAYCIGQRLPVMKTIETFGTEKKSAKLLSNFVDQLLDCSVRGIISGLDLARPIYRRTAAYGHFGQPDFPWERLSL